MIGQNAAWCGLWCCCIKEMQLLRDGCEHLLACEGGLFCLVVKENWVFQFSEQLLLIAA